MIEESLTATLLQKELPRDQLLRFQIKDDMEEERIDKCLVELIDTMSRSYLQKLFKEEKIFINEKPVKANYRVKAGDELTFLVPKSVEPNIEPEELPLDILYEDNDLLIINKEKGIVVHPAAGHYSGTIVNGVLYHCKGELSGINGVMRPGIVHRIDKDTTGSIIICKNDFSHQKIAAQLKEHSITRIYRAICFGVIQEESGTVNAPIGRHPSDRKKMAVNYKNGKEAITHFTVLQRFQKYTYLECRLETGRTHQIRVHMTQIGHPLLGDAVYTGLKSPYHLQGQCLHAAVIGFQHPRTGIYMEFEAPLPEYFRHLLDIL